VTATATFRLLVLTAFLAAAAAPAAAQSPADMPAWCRVPTSAFIDESKLVYAGKRVTETRRLTVVALGSSSTLGQGASAPQAAWPARLEVDLNRRMPGVAVTVHNRGKARDDAEQMLRRLESDVMALKPDVVIWETGTAEAMRHRDVEQFTANLQDGIGRIEAGGADVVLVTPQYSRETARLISYQPYIEAMNSIGTRREVLLFPRFEVMRHWVESGQMQLDNLTPVQAAGVADRVYDCIARQIGRVMIRAMSR
jgi:lysophospholipase L1-like esterase